MAKIHDKIITEAITWDRTPYHHHAMVKGVGVDCAMLVAGVAINVGLLDPKKMPAFVNYPTQWHLHNREEKLIEQLDRFGCTPKSNDKLKPGDIIGFHFGRTTSHLGIMISETEFIHARHDVKLVVINTMGEEWLKRWTVTYSFPGVN